VYIAIFSTIAIIIIQSLLYSVRTYAVAQSYRRLQSDGELVLERLTRDIRNAESTATGTFGTTTSILTLELPSGGTTATTTYQIVSGVLTATTNGTSVALTSNNVAVESFTVHSVVAGNEQIIRIRMTLRTNGKVETSSTFSNTIMLP
jgi:Tfp pilus assembly protein PilW